MINIQSYQALHRITLEKYKEDLETQAQIQYDPYRFRPNFIIDHGKPWCEEEFQQMRIGNIFMRYFGLCARCKAIGVNWDRERRDPANEPLLVLSKIRMNKQQKPVFGTYHQLDIVPSKEKFTELLPDYPQVSDRPVGPIGIVR